MPCDNKVRTTYTTHYNRTRLQPDTTELSNYKAQNKDLSCLIHIRVSNPGYREYMHQQQNTIKIL